MFGKGIYTTGGSRGPSRAFFVPSLSAMQLFTFVDHRAAQNRTLHMLSDAAAAQVRHLQPICVPDQGMVSIVRASA